MTKAEPLSTLLDGLSARYHLSGIAEHELETVPVRRVTADSREACPGALFVAVTGRRSDGHHFISAAVEAGAVAVVGTRSDHDLKPSVPYIQVPNARQALAELCAAYHQYPGRAMTVVGVTGTDGKTTTCSILESIFSESNIRGAEEPAGVGVITTIGARINGVEQDTGYHVTTPEAPIIQSYLAQMRDSGCRVAILESTSHGLDQKRVAAVEYDVAAVTNITHEHLDYHGSYEEYRAAKARLYRAIFHGQCKSHVSRLAVLNADDSGSYDTLLNVVREESEANPEVSVRTISYRLSRRSHPPMPETGADIWAEDLDYAPDRTRLTVRWWGEPFRLETHLIGDFNVANILCAVSTALGLGVSPRAIQRGVARLKSVLGRMQRIDRGQDFLALVDFAHSPASLERALRTLRPLVGSGGRLIAVFGSAGLRDRAKRRLMGRVSGQLADFTIITAEDPRTEDLSAINAEIAAGVEEFAPPDAYTIIPDRSDAIQHGIFEAHMEDVVVAFGKGHERSMCYGETEYPWSDQEAMRKALDRRLGHRTAVKGRD